MLHLSIDKKIKQVLFGHLSKFWARDLICELFIFLKILILIITFIFIFITYGDLGTEIPLFTSLPNKINQLSIKTYIYIIPTLQFIVGVVSTIFVFKYLKINLKNTARFISFLTLISVFILGLSAYQIIRVSSKNTYSFGNWFYDFFIPFLIAFIISTVFTKLTIKYAKKLKIIEYPSIRDEPQKVLTIPTPRGGAIGFFAGFAITSLIFLTGEQRIWGLVIGLFITTLTGYLDDRFKLSYLSRLLFFLPLSFVAVILSGFVMMYLPNPVGEAFKLDSLRIFINFFGEHSIVVYGALVSFLWFLWMSNMMSWNNGIDGQFVAISSVVLFVLALLSLRYNNVSSEAVFSAKVAFIALGSVLALLYFTFPPQKIIWGFGATGVGLLIGAIAILSGTRVAAASIALLIPSIDTILVIVNRIRNKKVPFFGDRNHLHHKLLDIGLSRKKIAIFYWLVSILFGFVAFFSSEKYTFLALLIFSGLVLYLIISIRLYAYKLVIKLKK
ncbi:undecaprenyl/decaprenyl-phosphate alpha-N-acetylglucosaminyl 1-phosphate transferase [Patescibacteria group bacterium]|nr:undecaprenyl/decaprenyl-phosphate alpha-N-acetylglucosaminyl 1-phosphate transferase [Patescibacteria group bacterium]